MASVRLNHREKIEVSQVTGKGIMWKLLKRYSKYFSAPLQSYC